jgi:aspartyl-tRNA synthetase
MFELNEETNKIEFSHNPFSMPQGGIEALTSKDPLEVKAFQYAEDLLMNAPSEVRPEQLRELRLNVNLPPPK